MIRAIGFDLWETLITDTPEAARRQEEYRLARMREILEADGASHLIEKLPAAYRTSWDRCFDLYWGRDLDVPTRRHIEHLVEDAGGDPAFIDEETLQRLETAYAEAALKALPELVAGAPETLRWARARGLRVGLISNTGRTPGWVLRSVLSELGLAPFIDAMVFSNEHGECKPRRSIFDALASALGVSLEETVFVGDNVFVDVFGAQQCGMRAVHFVPPVRGLAVASRRDPETEKGIRPDAVVTTLAAIPQIVERWA